MKLEINGQVVEVDDSFAELPPEQQQATVNEIAAQLSVKEKQNLANALYGISGGVLGANILGRPIQAFTEGMRGPTAIPPTSPIPAPPETRAPSSGAVENWAKTQHSGDFFGGRDYAGAHQRAMDVKGALAETPGFKAAQGTGLMAPREALEEFEARKAAKEALERRSQMSFGERFAERSPQAARMGAGAANVLRKGATPFIGRTAAGGMSGYQAIDAYNRAKQGDVLGAGISGAGSVGAAATLVPNPKVRAVGALTSILGETINRLRNPDIERTEVKMPNVIPPATAGVNNPMAAGGIVGYAKGKVVESGLDVAKKLFAPKPTKNLKPSEALGQHENKRLGLTQTDNFGVHGGRMGGNQFPNFQNISPKHAKDRVVWMNDTENHANAMVRNSKFGNEDVIWSTYIGAPDQLKSNKTVWNDILANHYDRNLTPEQVEIINKRIATLKRGKDKGLLFSQPFDIRDKFAVQELVDTFDRRSAMASMLGEGKGVGGKKMGIALPQYQDILRSHRDPLTEGVPTSSVGTRLFSVDPTPSRFSKEYHPDYEWTVHGQDMGVQFNPVPQKLIVPDWYARTEAKAPGKNLTHGNAWFSYMKDPQRITHEYLMNLEKAGYKTGGLVGIDKE